MRLLGKMNMIKEQDCGSYIPGWMRLIHGTVLDDFLSRSHIGDNQRKTSCMYIYHRDNFLDGV